MDPILQTLFSWQFLIFGIAVAAIMFVVRRTVEYGLANWTAASKESKLWNDLLLPILPVLLGAFGALIFKNYPYPDGLTTGSSRFIFGLVAGLLSTLFYRVIKALMFQRINTSLPNTATPINPEEDDATAQLANEVRQTINPNNQ